MRTPVSRLRATICGWRRRLQARRLAPGDEVGGKGAAAGDDPWRETFGTFVLYAVAVLAYAVAGMYWHFLLSWSRGFVFAFVTVWVLPALYRRWRP